eukprot:TRINITY_DN62992_c0_g1_i1.p1 TRINITY_DN62992_c0_g1~~TRINITY_DN62992_c0_g1_i1.p1  ORF type:complete len:237 (+),score=51.35 TRINITY_DN62992_c0_g1_i1:113-823(+)
MVVPLQFPAGGDVQAPDHVKEQLSKWWWMLVALLISVGVGQLAALHIIQAFVTAIIAFWAHTLVRNGCEQMTQSCVFSFGLICVLQAFFDLLPLLMNLPGRRTQKTSVDGSRSGSSKMSYRVTVEVHPFFDAAQGWQYNLQSAMMIASFVAMLVGFVVSKVTYNAFPTSIFADDGGEAGEQRPLFGGVGGARGPAGFAAAGGGRPLGGRPQQPGGGGQLLGRTNVFEGTGRRLGGD